MALAGGLGDPVAALVLCTPGTVDLSVVNGEVVVEGGRLLTCDVQVGCLRGGCRLALATAQLLRWQHGAGRRLGAEGISRLALRLRQGICERPLDGMAADVNVPARNDVMQALLKEFNEASARVCSAVGSPDL